MDEEKLTKIINDLKAMLEAMMRLKERGDNMTFEFANGSKFSVTRLN